MEEDGSKQPCECGSTQFGYYADQGICFVSFACGRFTLDGFNSEIEELFKTDPMVLLHLIQEGHLKSLSGINE